MCALSNTSEYIWPRLDSVIALHTVLREVAKVIIDRKDWERGMRAGNTVDGVVNTPFRRMIRKMPGQLLWVSLLGYLKFEPHL